MIEFYPNLVATRTICFQLPDGKLGSFDYAYLIELFYNPDEGEVVLTFTSATVTLKGYNLKDVFDKMRSRTVKTVICSNDRYIAARNENETMVTAITIERD